MLFRSIRGANFVPCTVRIRAGEGIGHIVPQKISAEQDFRLSLRVRDHYKDCRIVVRQGGQTVASKKMKKAIPAEMIQMKIKAEKLQKEGELEVCVQ